MEKKRRILMKIIVVEDYEAMSEAAADIFAKQIQTKPGSVLGFATGSSPVGTYKKLIELYNAGKLDFSKITTFNLDEYFGIDKNHEQSYYYFMHKNLFDHVNVDEDKVSIPSGTGNLEKTCSEYEKAIDAAGGIDLQILGIGGNGHIGFNEPGVPFGSTTHLVELDKNTIEANSRFFDSVEDVPTKAVTMGIKTIMNARSIVLIANGESKADAIYKTVHGPVSQDTPASVLQLHPNVTLIVDKEAASRL